MVSTDAIRAALDRLPPLDLRNRDADPRRCKICGNSAPKFDVVDFWKSVDDHIQIFGFSGVTVDYYRCDTCHFLFTDFADGWSPAEFSRYIYNADYVKVDPDYVEKRPREMAASLAIQLKGFEEARILDFGSGAGIFADQLRRQGFSAVESYDPFSQPQRPPGDFDIIFSLEVLEHSADPRETFAQLKSFLRPDACILASTALQPDDIETLRGNWPYVAPRNGHISIFSRDALLNLADQNGLLYLGANGLHGFLTSSAAGGGFAKLLRQVAGPVRVQRTLYAPPQAAPLLNHNWWYEVEPHERGHFRWSAAPTLQWRVDLPTLYPCTIEIDIPVFMEVTANFASRSTLTLGGQTRGVTKTPSGLKGVFDLAAPVDSKLTLQTPALLTPAELGRGDDARKLGLAIGVKP